MQELIVEKLPIKDLKPYENNAKEHPAKQIKQIMESIKAFGFNDPIAIDEDNVIIEGHGRLLAAQKLKLKEVPVIRLTHMSEAQKKAYIIAHNKLALNSGFNLEKI
jgi:ParB-like chromosome segregation protein Spo0J